MSQSNREGSKRNTSSSDDICSNCGKSGDGIKLKNCTACFLVKYCSVQCQKTDRKQHKKECRKRAAELKDEQIFKEVPHERGECPVCMLPMPLNREEGRYMSCCAASICSGCYDGAFLYSKFESPNDLPYPFCRAAEPSSSLEIIERV